MARSVPGRAASGSKDAVEENYGYGIGKQIARSLHVYICLGDADSRVERFELFELGPIHFLFKMETNLKAVQRWMFERRNNATVHLSIAG